jgi:hypothetical protein
LYIFLICIICRWNLTDAQDEIKSGISQFYLAAGDVVKTSGEILASPSGDGTTLLKIQGNVGVVG